MNSSIRSEYCFRLNESIVVKSLFQYYVRLGMPSDSANIPEYLNKPELNPLIGIIKFFFNHKDLIEHDKKKKKSFKS